MTKSRGRMKLGLSFNAFGSHRAAWRHPDAVANDMAQVDQYLSVAQRAEEGLFDFLFMADSLSTEWGPESAETLGRVPFIRSLDPLTLSAAVALATKNIGLIASINSTYNAPFIVARMLATLDHISHGRAGWNVVTGGNPAEAANFGDQPHPPAHERYARAREFVEVTFGLWDSWDADAFIADKASGRWFDPARMRRLNHKGAYFSVAGPLMVARPPQGRPITVQAGSSDEGRELAAATADIAFALGQPLDKAKAFYDDVKGRMAKYGRSPHELLIMPGAHVYVGQSEEEALEKRALMDSCYDPVVALHLLSLEMGTDMSSYPIDGPVPDLPTTGWTSRGQALKDMAQRDNLTLRQLANRQGSTGHWILAGTPESIADTLQEYFESQGADGFVISPPHMTGGMDDVIDLLIPELQRRGLFHMEYEPGPTLRARLGLTLSSE